MESDESKLLGKVPDGASIDMRLVAADMEEPMWRQLSAGEDRALCTRRRMRASDGAGARTIGGRVSRSARCATRACYRYMGALSPQHGRRNGTKTYAPPLLASVGAVESEPVEVEAVVPFEPEHDPAEEAVVGGAVLGERLHASVASGDGAGGTIHATDGSGESGGSEPSECAEGIAARDRGAWS